MSIDQAINEFLDYQRRQTKAIESQAISLHNIEIAILSALKKPESPVE